VGLSTLTLAELFIRMRLCL